VTCIVVGLALPCDAAFAIHALWAWQQPCECRGFAVVAGHFNARVAVALGVFVEQDDAQVAVVGLERVDLEQQQQQLRRRQQQSTLGMVNAWI
jgi:hypothetical protein